MSRSLLSRSCVFVPALLLLSSSCRKHDSDNLEKRLAESVLRGCGVDSDNVVLETADAGVTEVNSEQLDDDTSTSFVLNPNPAAPGVGIIEVTSSSPQVLAATIRGAGEAWSLTCERAEPVQRRLVLGLKPGTAYEADITLTNPAGDSSRVKRTLETPRLPDVLSGIDLLTRDAARQTPGWTLFNVRTESNDGRYLLVVDEIGQVRWWLDTTIDYPSSGDHVVLPNGQLLIGAARRELLEITWAGDILRSWIAVNYPHAHFPRQAPIVVELDSFHHHHDWLPNDEILALSTELREIHDYPTSTTDTDAPTHTASVIGDVIARITSDGRVLERISLLDILDPTRVGHGSLGTFWQAFGEDVLDWSHGNALAYDSSDDSYIVSLRNQDALVKVDRETQELVWILGTPENWDEAYGDRLLQPVGDLRWPFHQHALKLTTDGIGLYDNGAVGAPAYAEPLPDRFSRAVEYRVDADAMTVEQIWSYGPAHGELDSFFSPILSDADWLTETDNVLILSGALTDEASSDTRAELREVTRDGEIVWRVSMKDDAGPLTAYRAARIPDLRHWNR